MQSPRSVIVCADDFGFSEGVSIAIAELAALGRLSATSAMVLSPRWPADVALLRELRGRIDVGLHLDLTSAFAMSAGCGMSLGRAMARAVAGAFARAKASAVIERQLDAFEAQWKAAPDHVDGHQHVHQFAGIRGPLLDALDRRYGAASGPYLRISRPVGTGAGLKGRVVAALGAASLEREARARGRAVSPALTGVYDFGGTAAGYAALVDGWLRDAPEGAILMCHPASQAERGDAIGCARLREFEFWGSDAASEAFARAGVAPSRGPGPRRAAR
jgi:predicted glycoside hydrolase/deacetylase ChbG (UPF0249 family)